MHLILSESSFIVEFFYFNLKNYKIHHSDRVCKNIKALKNSPSMIPKFS
jgi:hypothetical protein